MEELTKIGWKSIAQRFFSNAKSGNCTGKCRNIIKEYHTAFSACAGIHKVSAHVFFYTPCRLCNPIATQLPYLCKRTKAIRLSVKYILYPHCLTFDSKRRFSLNGKLQTKKILKHIDMDKKKLTRIILTAVLLVIAVAIEKNWKLSEVVIRRRRLKILLSLKLLKKR